MRERERKKKKERKSEIVYECERVNESERKRGIYIVCMRGSKWTNKYETNNCDWLCMMRRHVSCIYWIIIFSGVSNVTEWLNGECMLTRMKTNVNGYRHVVNFQIDYSISNLTIISFLFKNLFLFLIDSAFYFYKIDHLLIYWCNNFILLIYYKIYIYIYILLDCCNLI